MADPSQLLPAREQMAFTFGFHIVLVPLGVAFTVLMLVANYRGIRRGDAAALLLARRWSQVAAILFAVGAVSGTALSFELGLLWPRLMGDYGAAYGIPFAIEGLFFFLEAIFIAIYLYGWRRLRPWPHFWTGLPVVLGVGTVLALRLLRERWRGDGDDPGDVPYGPSRAAHGGGQATRGGGGRTVVPAACGGGRRRCRHPRAGRYRGAVA